MPVNTDIDIDLYDRNTLLRGIRHVIARIDRDDTYTKHNTGVYFQDIPRDPMTGIATIDHKEAERLGYMKIDFLNNGIYKGIRDEDHLKRLVDTEPMWDILEDDQIIEQLFHIGQYADLVKEMKPRSVNQLAMLLAVIRPGKAHLRGKSWNEIEEEVWEAPSDGSYYFKKSHAISYAMAIIVQMNLLVEEAMKIG